MYVRACLCKCVDVNGEVHVECVGVNVHGSIK